MTARRDLNPQDEKRDRTLVAGTVNGKGMGSRAALDCSQLMTAREDLNLQDEKRNKPLVYFALSDY